MVITKNEIVLNKYDFCWRCGRDFNSEELLERKTYHHAIPQLYNPKYNIKIPVCQQCHYDMNPVNEKLLLAFLSRTKKNIDNFLSKYNHKETEQKLVVSSELKKLIKDVAPEVKEK